MKKRAKEKRRRAKNLSKTAFINNQSPYNEMEER